MARPPSWLPVMILAVSLLSLGTISIGGQEGSGDLLPDLAVTELDIIPSTNGYDISYMIDNMGPGPTKQKRKASIFDEYELVNGGEQLIHEFPVPVLNEGDEPIEGSISWEPSSGGLHRIWVVVDVEAMEIERDKSNNVAFVDHMVPSIRGVNSRLDGHPDPEVLGTYISGIPNVVEASALFRPEVDPYLVDAYMNMDAGAIKYGYSADGVNYTASFDMGELSPGSHDLTVNAKYSMYDLGSRTFRVEVIEMPPWLVSLDDLRSAFDAEKEAYVISGRHDLPGHDYGPVVDGLPGVRGISFCDHAGEIMITASIRLDGTTTIDVQADVPFDIGGSRYTVHMEGIGFMRGPLEDHAMSMNGDVEIDVDMLEILQGDLVEFDPSPGQRAMLPIHPFLEGTAECDLELKVNGTGPHCVLGTELNMYGSDLEVHRRPLPGYDRPFVEALLEVSWETTHDLAGQAWSDTGVIEVDKDLSIVDLGLSPSEKLGPWELPEKSRETCVARSGQGWYGFANLTGVEGSLSGILLSQKGEEIKIYENNTYMSGLGLTYLNDSSALMVWARAGYQNETSSRASSLGLMYSIVEGENITEGPTTLFDGLDSSPFLVSSPDQNTAVLLWQRDMDGDAFTQEGKEIFASVYSEGWGQPFRLTNDDVADTGPISTFDREGRLWCVWNRDDGSLGCRTMTSEGLWEPQRNITTLGRIEDCALMGSEMGVLLAYTRTGGYREDDHLLVVRTGNPSRETRWDDESIIHTSDDWMDSLVGSEGEGSVGLVWRGSSGSDGDLFGIIGSPGSWSDPLRLTFNNDVEVPLVFDPLGSGSFRLGRQISPDPDGPNSTMGGLSLDVVDLSWAADIIDTEISITDQHTSAVISVEIRNRALSMDGMARLDLNRISYDPSNGVLREEYLTNSMIEFSGMDDTETVQLHVPLTNLQQGFMLRAPPPLVGMPAHSSEAYISSPMLADIVVEDFELQQVDGGTMTARIGISNKGQVNSGWRDISIRMSDPTPPLSFNGSCFEPVGFRVMEGGNVANSTSRDIPAGKDVWLEMDIEVPEGVVYIWPEIEPYSWESDPILPEEGIRIERVPLLTMDPLEDHMLYGSKRSVKFEVVNEGGADIPYNLSSLDDPPGELVYCDLDAVIDISFLDPDANVVFSDSRNISSLGSGNTTEIEVEVPPQDAGTVELEASVRWGLEHPYDWPTRSSSITISTLIEPEIDLELVEVREHERADLGPTFSVTVTNPTNRTLRVVRLLLYNGFPKDDVVVGDVITVGLGPEETRIVDLPYDLEEGEYLLTVNCQVVDPWSDKTEWRTLSSRTEEFRLSEKDEEADMEKEDVDMDTITRVLLISSIAFLIVLGVSAVFKRKPKKREEDGK